MAITYEAAGQHEFSSATSALSFTPDSGTLTGDVFVVAVANRANATITPPAGTADQAIANLGPLGSDRRVSVFSWVAPSDAPGPVSVPLSASTTGSVTWTRFRGASGWFDADADNQAVGTSAVAPDLTVDEAGAFVLAGLFAESSSVSVSMGSGWTQRALAGVVRNFQATKGVQAAPGTSGSATITLGSSLGWVAWQVALAPAGATPPAEAENVMATGQTEYMPAGYSGDIADTPAIWVDPGDASRSVILGSRKASTGGGIDVYGLDGARLGFLAAGEINNVAVRDLKGRSDWGDRVLVVGTNRSTNVLSYFWLDRAARTLTAAGSTAVGFEPYGCCLYVSPVSGDVYAFVSESTGGAGGLKQYRLTLSGSTVSGTQVRSMPTATLSEGMACDDASQTFFLTEEDVGFFKYGAEPGAGTSRTEIDLVGGGRLFADVEGITIAYGRGSDPSYVIVSSQGDSTFVAYDLEAPHDFVKKWRVVGDGGLIGETTDTDGISITRADLSPWWPDGLFVAHDTANTDVSQPASNFKLVDAGRIFSELSYRPAVHTLADTSTANLTGPATRWSKSPMAPVWYDASLDTWRAILPTSTGHRLFTLNTDGSATQGAVVSADQGARVSAVHSGGTTYVLIAPAVGDTQHIFRRYDSSWTQTGSDVTILHIGTTFDRDAQPVTLFRASNGHLFIAWNPGDRSLAIRRSVDDGATWGGTSNTANLTMPASWNGVSGPVALAESGANLVLVATANEGGGAVVRTLPFTASPMTTAAWTSEALPGMPAGITSDDHLSMISLPDGRIFAVTKTTGSTDGTTDLFRSLIRETSGAWTQQTLEPGPDGVPPSYTRPRLTMLPSGEVLAFYGGISGANDLLVRATAADALGTWRGRSTQILGPNYSDSAVVPGPSCLAAAGNRPWPLLVHNRATSKIEVQWQPVVEAGEAPGRLGTVDLVGMFAGAAPISGVYIGASRIY